MTKSPNCPMCQTPNPWEARHSTETYRYKGQQFSLSDSEYSVCRECGFDVVLPRQKRQNEARIRDEHRRIDGLLTGPQIKAIRRHLGLTQAEAARLRPSSVPSRTLGSGRRKRVVACGGLPSAWGSDPVAVFARASSHASPALAAPTVPLT